MRGHPFLLRGAGGLAGVLSAAFVAAVVVQVTAVPAAHGAVPLPHAHDVPSTAGNTVAPQLAPPDPTAAQDMTHPPAATTWPKSGAADVTLPPAPARVRPGPRSPDWMRAGTLPVSVQQLSTGHAGNVHVEVLDHGATVPAARPLVVRIQAAGRVGVQLDYGSFRDAYGGDWAARLHLVRLPECALTTPAAAACQAEDLLTTNDPVTRTVSATVDPPVATQRPGAARPAVPSGTLVALAAAPSSDGGSYTATALQASASWSGGGSSGDFSWSYPMRVPPALGGPTPRIALDYSSQSSDGRTAASNSQPSWAGEGFDYVSGAIMRSYKDCVDDGQSNIGDQCWGGDNATLSLSGHSGELIQVSSNPDVWRLKDDDGTRVERFTGAANGDDNGEYWKVTTTDGTQYLFGLNRLPGWNSGKPETGSTWTTTVFGNNAGEPCNGSTFAASFCTQAYQWNLDYVIDPHGDSMSYWYTQEPNHYARNRTDSAVSTYVRGGSLIRIDYGTRQDAGVDSEFTANPPQRVLFGLQDRCVTQGSTCVQSNTGNWPDVPWDQQCDSTTSCHNQYSPTYFTQKMLATVSTQVSDGVGGYRPVETWTLNHAFKDPGDNHQKILWLNSISHTGDVGTTTTVPDVKFGGVQMGNRVDTVPTKNPIVRYRIATVTDETGSVLAVTYSQPECVVGSNMPASPENNTKRCYPVYWTPYGQSAATFDWFHKYVVTQVAQTDLTGGAPTQVTTYTYRDSPAWHYDEAELVPAAHKSWGQWRGYSKVRVTAGAPGTTQSQTDYTYFRGMNGDKLPSGTRPVSIAGDPDFGGAAVADEPWRAGQTWETVVYNGTGDAAPVVSKALDDPWQHGPTATRATNGVTVNAYVTGVHTTTVKTALDGGRGWRTTQKTNTFDYDAGTANPTGRIVMTDDAGDTSTTTDDRCTRTTYAANPGALLLTYVAEVESVGVNCATAPNRATDVLSDVRTWYDGAKSFGTGVSKGDPTRTEQLADWNGGNPIYVQKSRATYDADGRMLDSYDPLDHKTSTRYTPESGGPVTSATATNPMGWTSTTTYEPAWGSETSVVDFNGRRTDLSYDGLGRLTAVWLPGRDKAREQSASLVHTYLVRNSGGPTATATGKLNADGSGYLTTWTLYDGQLRPRQTQTPASGGGRLITDTQYDSRGFAAQANQSYFNNAAPDGNLFVPAGPVAGRTLTTYDSAGRKAQESFQVYGVERWHTSYYDGGDHTDLTVPLGATATSTWTDGRGHEVAVRQYHGNVPTGPYDTTTKRYTQTDQLGGVTDAAGNKWTYTYDQLGRKKTEDDPDKGHSSYTYDNAEELLTATDARQTTLAYDYDPMGRKTGLFEGSTSGTQLAAWTYDTLTDGTVVRGQAATTTRYIGASAYVSAVTGYDAAYRPTGTSVKIPPSEGALAGTYTSTTKYNVDGTPATMDLPAAGGLPAETVTYGYNSVGLPTTLSGLDTYVTETDYDSLGRGGTLKLSDGGGKTLTQIWNYEDGTNRLLEHGVLDEAAQVVYQDAMYGYDNAANVVSIKDQTNQYGAGPDANQCFSYDYLARLSAAWTPGNGDCSAAPSVGALGGPAPYWQSWTYDLAGDRQTQDDHTSTGTTTRTSSYPATGATRPHAVNSVTNAAPGGTTTDSYGYDAAGNTITRNIAGKPGQTLTWDTEGHLASATDKTGTTSYVYDADGTRLIAHDPSGATLYLGSQEVHAGGSTTSCTRYYGPNAVRTTAGGLSWTTEDHQGTTQFSFAAGTLAKTQRRAAPFGGPRGSAPAWPTTRGFVGGTDDASTGLVHLGAREYDPGLGRFISVDPEFSAADPQSWQGYAYAGNTPVTGSDPSGKRVCLETCGGPDDKIMQQATNAAKKAAPAQPQESGCSAAKLNCTVDDINHMTVPKRKKFVVDMLDLYAKKYNATDMFHNIMGVLDFMIDDHVAEYGSWASLVDSCILNGVEMGLAINEHKASASTVNPGAKKWATFFTYSQNNPGDSNQKRKLWSKAEEASTDWGEFKVAHSRGLSPTPQEMMFAGGAHVYRYAMRHEDAVDQYANQVCGYICYRAEHDFLDPRSYNPTYDGGHIASGVGRYLQGDQNGGAIEIFVYGMKAQKDAANWFRHLF